MGLRGEQVSYESNPPVLAGSGVVRENPRQGCLGRVSVMVSFGTHLFVSFIKEEIYFQRHVCREFCRSRFLVSEGIQEAEGDKIKTFRRGTRFYFMEVD